MANLADGNKLGKKYRVQLEGYVKALKTTCGEEGNTLTYLIDV